MGKKLPSRHTWHSSQFQKWTKASKSAQITRVGNATIKPESIGYCISLLLTDRNGPPSIVESRRPKINHPKYHIATECTIKHGRGNPFKPRLSHLVIARSQCESAALKSVLPCIAHMTHVHLSILRFFPSLSLSAFLSAEHRLRDRQPRQTFPRPCPIYQTSNACDSNGFARRRRNVWPTSII